MTARTVLAAVISAGGRPTVQGTVLVVAAATPNRLGPLLEVLHTGVRAELTGRAWYGCRGDGRAVRLSPAAPIPDGVELLAVEGDDRWDRIPPAARHAHPELFAD